MFLAHFQLISLGAISVICTLIHGNLQGKNAMTSILQRLQKEKPYESILLVQTDYVECFQEHIYQVAGVPIINLNVPNKYYLKGQFNSEMIAVVCLQNAGKLEVLKTLANYFQHMRDNRVIILLHERYENGKNNQLRKLLKTCQDLDLLFVNLFYADFYESLWYLSYKQYPQFEVQNHSLLMVVNDLFPKSIRNFKGKKVKVGTNIRLSRNYLNYDMSSTNITKATGILGWFMASYAAAYNVSLSYEVALNGGAVDRLENYEMSITAKIFSPNIDNITNCALLYSGWLVVLMPMDKPMKKAKFLLSVFWQTIKIFGIATTILICALIAISERHKISDIMNTYLVVSKMECFRGILGFSFIMKKRPGYLLGLAYMLIIIQGFFNASIYPANLGTIFTLMPKEEPVHTFDELLARGYPKILKGYSPTNSTFNMMDNKIYGSLYVFANASEGDFYENVLPNPDYAYDLLSDHWPLLDYLQKKYKVTLFRIERNMKYPLPSPIIMGFIFPSNSPFQKSIKMSYLYAEEAGLPNVWLLRNRTIIIHTTNSEPQSLTLDDYDKLFFVYLCMLTLAFFIFIIEISMESKLNQLFN